MEYKDQHLNILLDIQKQLGALSRETGEQTEKLKSIEYQTIKTNGRVLALEKKNEQSEKEKEFIRGKMAVISFIAGALGAIIMSAITKIVTRVL
jgi:hypothetical protein